MKKEAVFYIVLKVDTYLCRNLLDLNSPLRKVPVKNKFKDNKSKIFFNNPQLLFNNTIINPLSSLLLLQQVLLLLLEVKK